MDIRCNDYYVGRNSLIRDHIMSTHVFAGSRRCHVWDNGVAQYLDVRYDPRGTGKGILPIFLCIKAKQPFVFTRITDDVSHIAIHQGYCPNVQAGDSLVVIDIYGTLRQYQFKTSDGLALRTTVCMTPELEHDIQATYNELLCEEYWQPWSDEDEDVS